MTETRFLADVWSTEDATPEQIAAALRLLTEASGGTFTYEPLDGAVEITMAAPPKNDGNG